MTFNAGLAKNMYGVTTEEELREKIYGTRSAITAQELQEIKDALDGLDAPTYIEIGVYFGGTFALILDHLMSSGDEFKAYGIDLFEDLKNETFGNEQTHELFNKWDILNVAYRDALHLKLQKMNFVNFSLLKGSSEKMIKSVPACKAVCLIDGNHTYKQAKLDAEACLSVCESGSILIFDNSSNDIEPDPRYVKLDGGPWKVCEELRADSRLKFKKRVHRCTFFEVL